MLYARQIAPEYQESPLFIDGFFPEGIVLTGNRDFESHTTPEYDKIMADFDDMAYTWENYKSEYTLAQLLEEFGFFRPDRKPWTTAQHHAWEGLLEGKYGHDDEQVFLPALELLTGKKWESGTIHGACQSDWQNVYYPVNDWSREALSELETEYFNTGTEWIIHERDDVPDGPDDIDGYSVYCHGWSDSEIQQEIASVGGENDPSAVVLYKFTGWTQSPRYERVG